MGVPNRHILHQAPVIAALGRTALGAMVRRVRPPRGPLPAVPGPERVHAVAPRPASLVRDYIRHVGGDPEAYRGTLPAHLFPQWSFPLASRVLAGLPYPLERVLNAGCRMELHGPLADHETLSVRVRLESIDDDGRRAVLCTRVVTGTAEVPDALVAHLYALVPLARGGGSKKDPARVPADARELARFHIDADAGLSFAKLTGDFNPVHWVPAYARAFGFRACILHGFSTMARAIEGLNRHRFGGDVQALSMIDVRFTRPLVLPADVGLFVKGEEVFVGDAEAAYLTGRFA